LPTAARRVAADQGSNGAWEIDAHSVAGSPATYGSVLATHTALKVLKRFRRTMVLLLRVVLVRKIGDANSVSSQRLLKLRPLRLQGLKITALATSLRVNGSVARNGKIERKLRAGIGPQNDGHGGVAALTKRGNCGANRFDQMRGLHGFDRDGFAQFGGEIGV